MRLQMDKTYYKQRDKLEAFFKYKTSLDKKIKRLRYRIIRRLKFYDEYVKEYHVE